MADSAPVTTRRPTPGPTSPEKPAPGVPERDLHRTATPWNPSAAQVGLGLKSWPIGRGVSLFQAKQQECGNASSRLPPA